ncbi:alpha/beta fold hydrolase [Streptomyces sp. NPDC045431]|uniref:thioesterase II family protein n=1 Tax=Streptomyces sp. NPDC045431 TaxID=3155613 RepID=UPI0033CBB798
MASDWFRRFATTPGSGVRLFCFPHAGGAAGAYLALSRRLAPEFDVLAAQYPGRQDRRDEPPLEDVGSLVEALADQLKPLCDDGRPYAFLGHSMGALLAYELTRALDGRGLPGPRHLFLSGRSAPARHATGTDLLDTDEKILARIRLLGGTAGEILDEPELMELVMPPLRADYRALRSYAWQPGPPLRTPLTVLVGDSDPVVPVEAAAAWREHTTAGSDLRVLPGGHFYLDHHTDAVAGIIRTRLEAV